MCDDIIFLRFGASRLDPTPFVCEHSNSNLTHVLHNLSVVICTIVEERGRRPGVNWWHSTASRRLLATFPRRRDGRGRTPTYTTSRHARRKLPQRFTCSLGSNGRLQAPRAQRIQIQTVGNHDQRLVRSTPHRTGARAARSDARRRRGTPT